LLTLTLILTPILNPNPNASSADGEVFLVYTILQPAGQRCGGAAAANFWSADYMRPAVCLLKCSRHHVNPARRLW